MVLAKWEPFRELRRMDETMDRLWRGSRSVRRTEGWSVPLDVTQDGDNIVVHGSLPGVKPEDIEVTIEDGLLTVRGETASEREDSNGNYILRERRSGKFHRSLRLPDTVDADSAETRYENGVLAITLPKIEAKKAKRLEINSGE